MKLGTQIERKIEQSVLGCYYDQKLYFKELITVGRLLAQGGEGEASFWRFYEQRLIEQPSFNSLEEVLGVMETLSSKWVRKEKVWQMLLSELETKLTSITDPNELIEILKVLGARDHNLWVALSNFIINQSSEIPYTKEHLLDIVRAFHNGQRTGSKVWPHLNEKYFTGKSIFLQMTLAEIEEVESYYSAAGKLTTELKETLYSVRKLKKTSAKEEAKNKVVNPKIELRKNI